MVASDDVDGHAADTDERIAGRRAISTRSAQALVPGDRVRVARIDGLTLTVTPIAAHSDAAASAPGPESAAPDTHHLTPGSTPS